MEPDRSLAAGDPGYSQRCSPTNDEPRSTGVSLPEALPRAVVQELQIRDG